LPVWFSINADYLFLQFTIPIDNGDSVKTAEADSQRTLYPYVTGTSIVAIKYKDGVLMASDMGGSYGSTLRYKNIERMKAIGKHSLLGASGEISDFQEILRYLDELVLNDNMWDDGNSLGPKEVHNYLTRVMYNRRNKFNPLWNTLVLGGVKNGESYLGMVSMIGVSFEDNHVATGFGNHLARPILRDEWRADLSFEDGVKLLEKCMRVLLYRDRSAINKLQIAKITEEGVTVSQPYSLKTFWEFKAFNNPTAGAEGSCGFPSNNCGYFMKFRMNHTSFCNNIRKSKLRSIIRSDGFNLFYQIVACSRISICNGISSMCLQTLLLVLNRCILRLILVLVSTMCLITRWITMQFEAFLNRMTKLPTVCTHWLLYLTSCVVCSNIRSLNSKESNNRQAELSILGKEASKSRTQTKKDRETKEDLRNEIPNREAEKIQESRKQRDRETHNEAEDSYVCSDTISNLELEIGTEHGEARERERERWNEEDD
ncbi:unnamed protein product, partial [Brassica rapa subsp. trilocularis]